MDANIDSAEILSEENQDAAEQRHAEVRTHMDEMRKLASGVPSRNPVEKAQDAPKSLRKAVNAYCWMCSGRSKVEVGRCPVKSCELYALRPWKGK